MFPKKVSLNKSRRLHHFSPTLLLLDKQMEISPMGGVQGFQCQHAVKMWNPDDPDYILTGLHNTISEEPIKCHKHIAFHGQSVLWLPV